MKLLKQSSITLFLVLYSFIGYGQVTDHWETVVYNTDQWSYFVGNSEPNANWANPSFNASTWPKGSGGIGYEDEDDNTIISQTRSLYIRTNFTLVDVSVIKYFVLHADYDDAFVAYLNGTEIARNNIGTVGVRPSYNTYADTYHEANLYQGGLPDDYIFNEAEFKSLLNSGTNTLAVQIHNNSPSSSDLSSNFFLSLGISDQSKNYRKTPSWFQSPNGSQVSLMNVKLPIIVITTENNTEIQNEPKVSAQMGIINNGPGVGNSVTDPFNEYNGAIGIEIRGASSQNFPKKNYSLETRNEDGSNNNVSIFGMPSENDWVLHGPFSDKTLLRNVLAYHMGESTDRYTPRTQICELLINGDYRGVYMFTEKLKRDKNRVDIAKLNSNDITGEELTGGYLFQIDRDDESTVLDGWWTNSSPRKFVAYHDPSYEELADVQRQYLKDYFTSFENAMDGSQYMTDYTNFIDESSWVDYFLVTEVTKHIDAYKLSFYMHKKKSSNGGKIHFGPLWDFNLGFGNFDFVCSPNPQGWSFEFQGTCDYYQPFWVKKLTNIPDVSNRINCRWSQLRNGPLHSDSLMKFINDKVIEMGDAPERNFNRWNTLGNYIWPNNFVGETYEDEINYLKNWLGERLTWMDENMIGECIISAVNEPLARYSSIGLFPNPGREYVYVDIDYADLSNLHVAIMNPLGTLVVEGNFDTNVQKLDVSKLPAGLYIVNILRGDYVLGTKTLLIK